MLSSTDAKLKNLKISLSVENNQTEIKFVEISFVALLSPSPSLQLPSLVTISSPTTTISGHHLRRQWAVTITSAGKFFGQLYSTGDFSWELSRNGNDVAGEDK